MASLLGKPPSLQRSTSTSSSSATTVQRASVSSSRNGARSVASTLRSQSPSLATGESTTSRRPLTPEQERRTNSRHSRRSSMGGMAEGMGNLNRWSQSTASSKTSGLAHNRKNSFARRLSGSFGALGGFANSQSPPVNSNIRRRNVSPGTSPQRRRAQPTTPPVQGPRRRPATSHLTSSPKKIEVVKTPSTSTTMTPATVELLTPPEHAAGYLDYFGAHWSDNSPQKRRGDSVKPATSPASRGSLRQLRTTGTPRDHNGEASMDSSSPHRPSSQAAKRERDNHSRPRHSRNGEKTVKENGASEGDRSRSGATRDADRSARRKAHSQKAMLSRALQKANHAVLLDNAQNYEGAVEAYSDACNLLARVMIRSTGEADRRKLDTIRVTYSSRIVELQHNELRYQTFSDKALPEVPKASDSKADEPFSPTTEDDEEDDCDRFDARKTVMAPQLEQQRQQVASGTAPYTIDRERLPPRRTSLMPFRARRDGATTPTITVQEQDDLLDASSIDSLQESVNGTAARIAQPMASEYMPPPLSPRRPLSPAVPEQTPTVEAHSKAAPQNEPRHGQHFRHETAESTSWLDTIDESGGSSASSVHSRSSSAGLRRKHIRAPSGDTEAEFDAALDAAVEAAYDDGFEPVIENVEEDSRQDTVIMGQPDFISDARKNVDLAKERVREAEREAAIAVAKEQHIKGRWKNLAKRARSDSVNDQYEPDEVEEEERILEEMTRDYTMGDTEYDVQSKSALPRQSDSSGFSGRTWGSSIGSNPTTAGTALSSVAELSTIQPISLQLLPKTPPPPSRPPPSGALPLPPQAPLSSTNVIVLPSINGVKSKPTKLVINTAPGVRERRLSGQKAKQLIIDTTVKLPNGMPAPKTQPPSLLPPVVPLPTISDPPKSAGLVEESNKALSSAMLQPGALPGSNREPPSPLLAPSSAEPLSGISPATPASSIIPASARTEDTPQRTSSPYRAPPRSPGMPGILKKNYSSSSLRSLRPTASNPHIPEEPPHTPLSRVFSSTSQTRQAPTPIIPDLPTPQVPTFKPSTLSTNGITFLDTDIHHPVISNIPNPSSNSSSSSTSTAPLPLEPCPDSYLLRPFWLLRRIYHSIAHPRGAYLSTRLFLPRDIWRVKNVKLKGVDEKVSNCDLLTAALLKLGKVDMLDADAVLEEMQALEIVLDHIQALLTKKLGSEVGVQGSAAWLKGSPTAEEGEGLGGVGSRSVSAGKNYFAGLRKLRPKTSAGAGNAPPLPGVGVGKEAAREALTMRSVPMTQSMSVKVSKREVAKVVGVGPNRHYMTALARLCDAAQVLDQIARQVEDPGLKYSSQTHVGLELSTRHAAEFFAFYICRFVLTDVGLMLDKFVKRGSEWVLA